MTDVEIDSGRVVIRRPPTGAVQVTVGPSFRLEAVWTTPEERREILTFAVEAIRSAREVDA